MLKNYIETADSFLFCLEDTPDNIIDFINNPNILVVRLELVDKFNILQDIIFRNSKTLEYSLGYSLKCGIQRDYSENIQKVRVWCYIKHKHCPSVIISISNPMYTTCYKDILKLMEGEL